MTDWNCMFHSECEEDWPCPGQAPIVATFDAFETLGEAICEDRWRSIHSLFAEFNMSYGTVQSMTQMLLFWMIMAQAQATANDMFT